MSNSSSNSGGMGFVGALTITFIALKLIGVVTWSWLWVLSPIWIMVLFLIVFIGALSFIVSKKRGKK